MRTRLTALCALVAACSADDPVGPQSPALDAEVEEFVLMVNAHRTSVGCAALKWNVAVSEVAQAHSDDMVQRTFFSHANPDGASPGDRLNEATVPWSRWAENIAAGQQSAEAVLDAWLGSPGHRANIDDCSLTDHGVGLLESHWTHLFIRP